MLGGDVMARKQQVIRTESYVKNQAGELVRFDTLPADVKKRVATELSIRFLNEAYVGQLKFSRKAEEN